MDPIRTLNALDAKLQEYQEEACEIVDRSSLFNRFDQAKIRLVSGSEKIHRERQQMERVAQDGALSEAARDSLNARHSALVEEVRQEAQEATEKIRSTYGVTELPEPPLSEEKHRKLSLLVAQLDRMSDSELSEKVAQAALADPPDRATVQALEDEVQRRLEDHNLDPHTSHPLKVAERSVEVAHSNHQTEAARLAQEKAQNLRNQLDTVIRTVENHPEGRWAGAPATTFDGQGRRASTPDLAVAGPAERAAYERYVDPEDRSAQVAEATEDLPEGDPVLSLDDDTSDPGASREDRMRDRIQNRGG